MPVGLIVFIIFNTALILFLLKTYEKEGYLHPVLIVTIYWFLALLIPIIATSIFNLYFNWSSLVPIYLILCSFILGGLYCKIITPFIKPNKNEFNTIIYIAKKKSFFYVIVLFSFLGFISIVYHLRVNGFTDIGAAIIGKHAEQMSIFRYSEKLITPKSVMLLYAFNYMAAAFSGSYFVVNKFKPKRLFAFSPIMVGFLGAISTGSGAGLIILFSFWISSFIITSATVNNGKIRNLKKVIRNGTVSIFGLIVVFSLIHFLRGGGKGDYSIFAHSEKMVIYFFGYLSAFSEWWQSYERDSLGWGAYDFAGIFNLFFHNRQSGIFSDFAQISATKNTNIYTIYRSIIQDFTLAGGMIMAFGGGMLSNYLYAFLLNGKTIGYVFFIVLWVVLIFSIITNAMNYNVVIFSFVLIALFINIFKYKITIKIP